MKKDFLFELLVQELPYKFIPSAIAQLKTSFEKLFKEQALSHGDIKVYATPRRLAVIVNDLALEQESLEKDVKGPILSIAKDENGNLTKAGSGFALKNGVSENDLYEKDNYIWAKIKITGRKTTDILKENLENLILKLQGAHFMRWGYNSEKFSRPIEGVVALLGADIVDLAILDKKAGNKTQGHRYSKNRIVEIDEAKNYINLLKNAQVFVNQEERRQMIIENAQKCAKENNLTIKFDDMDDLLEEVTFITEYPVSVLCDFDKKYLEIPSIVTTTVMTQHQRYFPLWDNNCNLSNYFITMANYVGDDFSNIKAGNQRVICARLEDGIFFFKEDTKTKLEEKLENLKGMTFQKGLGTLFDKTQRMIKISEEIAKTLLNGDSSDKNINQNSNLNNNSCSNANIKTSQNSITNLNIDDILRCAKLAKCDLSTKLVFEFTELQGFIGENYARLDGEKENVAKGICEHYFPLGANSALPQDITGQIVSLADKIDTINALFIATQGDKKKKRPTGSNDPLGARRASIGILRTIIEKKLNLNLENLIKFSLELLSKEFSIPLEETIIDELREFYIQRLLFMYEKEFNANVVSACTKFNPLVDLNNFIERVKILVQYQNKESFEKLKENATRVSKILKSAFDKTSDKDFNLNVNVELFNSSEEKNLYNAINDHREDISNLEKYIESLNVLIKPIEEFFEKVLVMDKDENIKNNRIALLNLLNQKFNIVCEFEKL